VIRVNRPPANEAITKALSKHGKHTKMSESEAALWFYANEAPEPRDPMPAKPTEAPEFKAYKDDAVKQQLNEMFDGHCAYCESRYAHVVKMDVEHYRPKGAVIESDGTKTTPGYFWLASNWENLLPSCNLCNRANTQELTNVDGSTIATKGKANFFPLPPGSVRAAKKGDEVNESPLLLDPCNPYHDPKPHLLFRSDGLVEPRQSPEEQAMPRGLATINTCALDRSTLVEIRRVDATRLRDAMAGILRADRRSIQHPDDEIAQEERAEEEAELGALIPQLNFRALSHELLDQFKMVRAGVTAYYEAERKWRSDKSGANNRTLVATASSLVQVHARAGLHQSFVAELLKVARIPLGTIAT